jgi:hypothetical protein
VAGVSGTIWHDVSSSYTQDIVHAGKQPGLFFLLAFLATFAIVRGITHAIRDGRLGLKNVEAGNTHIHHLVWGILLLILCGYGAIALDFFPSREVLALGLGVGVGLTLDEFALWLELRDVYWSAQGRLSIDAVVITAVLAALVLLGLHFWVDVARRTAWIADWSVAGLGIWCGVQSAICLLKGKPVTAVVGLFVGIVGLIGMIRLATPRSWWARRYGPKKRARMEKRFASRRHVEHAVEHDVRSHV